MNNTGIKRKIAKLLALGRSPNPQEAASARAKALDLQKRYGMSGMETAHHSGNIVEKDVEIESPLNTWRRDLLACVAEISGVEVLSEGSAGEERVFFIGSEAGVITGEHLFLYLERRIIDVSRKYGKVVRYIDDFRRGMVAGIEEQFLKSDGAYTKPKASMVVIISGDQHEKDQENYIRNTYGNIEYRDDGCTVDPNSYGLGKAVGRKTSLNPQVDFH